MALTKDILQRIEDELELMGKGVDNRALLLRLINTAQDTASRDLSMPLRYIKDVPTNATFTLPTEARPGGLKYAEVVTPYGSKRVDLWTVTDANREVPGWERNPLEAMGAYTGRDAPFVIYDPVNISAPLYPVGFQTGNTLRLLYSIKPEAMDITTANSQAFNGEMDEYASDIIYGHVMFEVLLATGDQRSNVFRALYNDVMDKAFNYYRPMYHIARVRSDAFEE